MTPDDFRAHAHQVADWMADYLETVGERPVKSRARPGEITARLPASAPEDGEPFEAIMADFNDIIVPGLTHWQHPGFFAYFPANASPPSILAEMLAAVLATQCMSWQTSPAATELEGRVMEWLRELVGLPADFIGAIQDTASTATLCAILAARERASDFATNHTGLSGGPRMTTYCSSEGHSSIDKAVRIAGLGSDQLRKIAVDQHSAMDPAALDAAIAADAAAGLRPVCVVATLGSTSQSAVDPLRAIGAVCRRHGVWLHVDAAWAGSALVLPEMRWMIDGIEAADSLVFNPHKWLLTQLECSAFYVRDKAALIRTFEILPEYLKTREGDQVTNYRDWGVQLGRRFRALKLWFVLRSYGRTGLQAHVRRHIALAQDLAARIAAQPDFEVLAPSPLALVCFRYHPPGLDDAAKLDALNETLLETLNDSGALYLTQTRLDGAYVIRFAIGAVLTEARHVEAAWEKIQHTARRLGEGT